MRVTVEIETQEPDTIADGAGMLAAKLLRDVANSAEIGGMVSGPLHLPLTGERIGRYSVDVSRERI